MNAELEALLKTLQAVFDAHHAEEGKALLAAFELELDEAAKRLAVSKDSLRQALYVHRLKWIKAQHKPSSIPPKA